MAPSFAAVGLNSGNITVVVADTAALTAVGVGYGHDGLDLGHGDHGQEADKQQDQGEEQAEAADEGQDIDRGGFVAKKSITHCRVGIISNPSKRSLPELASKVWADSPLVTITSGT